MRDCRPREPITLWTRFMMAVVVAALLVLLIASVWKTTPDPLMAAVDRLRQRCQLAPDPTMCEAWILHEIQTLEVP